jgi:hypothetical protein
MNTTSPPNNGSRATARPVSAAPAPAQTNLPKVSRLASARRGPVHRPPRICIYGAKKIGKTTLACAAPNPLLIDANRGSEYLNVTRFPFYPGEANETSPRTFSDLMDGLREIRDTPSEYRTLILDVMNDIETLIWQHILKEDSGQETPNNPKAKKLTSIEDYGYFKGYQIAVDRGWIPLLALLDEIRDQRNMTIVLVEHAAVKNYKNPTGDDYDRHVMKIQEKAAAQVAGWVDVLAFYSFDDLAAKRLGAKRAQGVSSGRRVLHVEHDAVWEGGSRIPLPGLVEIAADDPWRPFAEAIAEGQAMPPEHLLADIETELARIADEHLTQKTRAWCEGKAVDALWRCLVGLRHKADANPENAPQAQES